MIRCDMLAWKALPLIPYQYSHLQSLPNFHLLPFIDDAQELHLHLLHSFMHFHSIQRFLLTVNAGFLIILQSLLTIELLLLAIKLALLKLLFMHALLTSLSHLDLTGNVTLAFNYFEKTAIFVFKYFQQINE